MPTSTAKSIEYLRSDHFDPVTESPPKYPPSLKLVQLGFKTLAPAFPKQAAKIAYRLFSTPRFRARHKTSDKLLESARIFEFLYGKHVLKGYEWGSGEQTILLVHGWESRGTALRTFVPNLVERGYRVVAFDGPAHGDSAGKRTNLIHFAGAVRAALRQTGQVHGMITHSFGGASTVYALSKMKEPIAIEKLVLIAVPHSIKRVLDDTIHLFRLPKAAAREFYRLIEKRLQANVQETEVTTSQGKKYIGEALIVHDEEDPVVEFESAKHIYEHWDNAALLATKGYGHYRLMKNPDLIRRVAEFMG
jgi:pimeloyl-ACP methyl ester carboxylesterase